MDLRKLKTLVDLVSESNISELEITEADGKVRIVKSEAGAARGPGTWVPQPHGRANACHGACDASSTRCGAVAGRAGRACRRTRNGSRGALTDGWHLLPRVGAGCQAAGRRGASGQGRRPDLHHRSDEDHERDRRRHRPAPSPRSWSKTARRWSSINRCWSSNRPADDAGLHVHEDPDRQPRRPRRRRCGEAKLRRVRSTPMQLSRATCSRRS